VTFSSLAFLFLFLPVTLALYLAAPLRCRNAVLLTASLLFYAYGEQDRLAILLACIAVNWWCGLTMRRGRGRRAQAGLLLAILFDVGLLAYFKYGNFAVENLNVLRSAAGYPAIILDPIALPIGVSFFAFQALSYVIDVYRGDVPAERRLGTFALYKAFFPQLIAGPIVRYRDVRGQLGGRIATTEQLASGIRRFIVGLGKKILIANTAAVTADRVFAIPMDQLTTPVAWLGLAAYTLCWFRSIVNT